MKTAHSPPFVLVGRGGSGTRLLAQLVSSLGGFLGNELNVSLDSIEWVEDLYCLALETLEQDHVPGSRRDRAWCERLTTRAQRMLSRAPAPGPACWGWKLPETILCLPQVLRAFPGARVVHLTRHPFTSAFRRTHMTSRADNPIGRAVLPAAYRARGWEVARIAADAAYMHNAITWAFQTRKALTDLAAISGEGRVLHLKYEALCEAPERASSVLAAFLGFPPALHARRQVLDIDDARCGTQFAHSEAGAAAVWAVCGKLATQLGYSRDL